MEIEPIPFTLTALLGSTELTWEDFKDLSLGDVLLLDQLTIHPLGVRVGAEYRFLGFPGEWNQQKALQIEQMS